MNMKENEEKKKSGEKTMRFEIGKYYKHSSGNVMRILSCGDTTIYGKALIVEQGDTFGFRAVGFDNYTENWKEISEDEWLSCSVMKQERNNYPIPLLKEVKLIDDLKIYLRGYHEGQLDLMRELRK